MTTKPTFRQGDRLLIGADAIAAWEAQSVRCACGSYGDKENAISGSCKDMPAKWLGCDNCDGTALGRPLVYRVQSQIATALAESK